MKNIDNKTDNELLAIRDEEDRQLDLIDEINAGRTKSFEFQNEILKNLEKEIRNKEKEIRKNKRSKIKEEQKKPFLPMQSQTAPPMILVETQNY